MRNMPSKRHQHVPLMTSFWATLRHENVCQVSKVDAFIVLLLFFFPKFKMQMQSLNERTPENFIYIYIFL